MRWIEIEQAQRLVASRALRGELEAHAWRLRATAKSLEIPHQRLIRLLRDLALWEEYQEHASPPGRPPAASPA